MNYSLLIIFLFPTFCIIQTFQTALKKKEKIYKLPATNILTSGG